MTIWLPVPKKLKLDHNWSFHRTINASNPKHSHKNGSQSSFLKPSFLCPAVNPKSVERVRGEESITDLGVDCGMVSDSFLCVL